MDPATIATIGSSVINLLAAYLKKRRDKPINDIEKDKIKDTTTNAWKITKELYSFIKTKFIDKKTAIEALNNLEKYPDNSDIQADVCNYIIKMMDDEAFAKKLIVFLRDATNADADTVFNTNISGGVQKLIQMGNVYGDVNIQ